MAVAGKKENKVDAPRWKKKKIKKIENSLKEWDKEKGFLIKFDGGSHKRKLFSCDSQFIDENLKETFDGVSSKYKSFVIMFKSTIP